MKKYILGTVLFFVSSIAMASGTIYIGKSARLDSYNIGLVYGIFDIEWVDEGHQPYNIPNINRVLNLDLRFSYEGFYAKWGVTTSRYGFNGSGNGYQNTTGFTGHNEGLGYQYSFDNIALGIEIINSQYQQVSVPAFETFQYMDGYMGINF